VKINKLKTVVVILHSSRRSSLIFSRAGQACLLLIAERTFEDN